MPVSQCSHPANGTKPLTLPLPQGSHLVPLAVSGLTAEMRQPERGEGRERERVSWFIYLFYFPTLGEETLPPSTLRAGSLRWHASQSGVIFAGGIEEEKMGRKPQSRDGSRQRMVRGQRARGGHGDHKGSDQSIGCWPRASGAAEDVAVKPGKKKTYTFTIHAIFFLCVQVFEVCTHEENRCHMCSTGSMRGFSFFALIIKMSDGPVSEQWYVDGRSNTWTWRRRGVCTQN